MIENQEFLSTEEKINNLVDKFASWAINNNSELTWQATVKAHRKKSNYLDCLARLLAEKEVCTAVLFDGERLTISSNENNPKYAKTYMNILSQFINDSFSEIIYNKLIELALRNVNFYLNFKDNLIRINEVKENVKMNEAWNLLEKINRYCQEAGLDKKGIKKIAKAPIYNENELREVEALMKKLSSELKKIKEDNPENMRSAMLIWGCVSFLSDVNIMTNAICDGGFDKKIVEAIKKKNIEYVTSKKTKLPTSKRKLHAEMKLVEKFCRQADSMNDMFYIGLSKLSCAPCWITIDLLNKIFFTNSFNLCGTHGTTYYGWETPNIHNACKLGLLKELEEIASKTITYQRRPEHTRIGLTKYLNKFAYEDLQRTIQEAKERKEIAIEEKELELENKSKINLKTRTKKRLTEKKEWIKTEEKIEAAREREINKRKTRERLSERMEKQQAQIQQANIPNFNN